VKVVFVNRFFHPDLAPTGQLAADVAFDLAAAGREVHAVTSRIPYDGAGAGYPAEETLRGVRVHRVWTTRFGRGSLPGRALDYASFYVAAAWCLARLVRPGDVVVAKTDPPLISVVAASVARLRGARVVNWVQDLFPEAAVALGFRTLGGLLGAPLRAARNWSLRAAALNVVLGERMADRVGALAGHAPGKIRIVHNWADGARIRPVAGRQEKFVVGYSGNMGRAHDIETLVAACVRMKDERQVEFVFTGGGQKRILVERAIREHRLENLRLLPYVDESRLGESLGACNVHLVAQLQSAEGLVVPSKFYGIAAAGRPTIFVGDPDGEIARILRAHACGVSVASGDVAGLVAAIRALASDSNGAGDMGKRARTAFEANWDKPIALARWRRLVDEAAGPPPVASTNRPG
jgi:colanic acid biosynthesis glycosyl transferase WcaI